VNREFDQISWDERLADQWRAVLRLALEEDLGTAGDLTGLALVPGEAEGRAALVARQPGVVAGLPIVPLTLEAVDTRLRWHAETADGRAVAAGQRLGTLEGPARGLLSAERLILNALGRLCGVAALTRRYVDAVAGTGARIFDTRKTTPAWRRLEKYAVRCGGGWNHRVTLSAAVLIKDNHLAFGAEVSGKGRFAPADAVRRAVQFVAARAAGGAERAIVEVEVDTLEQLGEVLPAGPDLVLLDNMTPEQLRQAVALRSATCPQVELEASGGVNLATVRAIAETGVERISVGALTHAAPALDLGLDWICG
jgi:nicotinate-nucleotide pyrophosphorylase (carboxylating)